MPKPSDSKLYDQFTPTERVTLMLEAMAREDRAEVDRLRSSCPKKSYTMSDAAYADRMQAAMTLALGVSGDLRELTGRLFILGLLREHVADLLHWTGPLLDLAFDRGRAHERGESGGEAEEEVAGPSAGSDAGDPQAGERKDESGGEAEVGDGDDAACRRERARVRKLSKIVRRSTAEALDEMANAIARDQLLRMWEGLGRFCRAELGVEPMTLLKARGVPGVEGLAAMLERYREAGFDEAKAAGWAEDVAAAWANQLG